MPALQGLCIGKENLQRKKILEGGLGMGLEEFAEEGGGVFAELAVFGAEGGEEVGVDVEFASDFAVDEDGHDDFGFGFKGAGDVAGIGVDVVDDDGFAGRGRRATNALIERDAGVGRHGALEGAEGEDVAIAFFFEHVEADPVVTRELFVKEGDNALHEGFGGGGSFGQGVQIRDEVCGFRMCCGHGE